MISSTQAVGYLIQPEPKSGSSDLPANGICPTTKKKYPNIFQTTNFVCSDVNANLAPIIGGKTPTVVWNTNQADNQSDHTLKVTYPIEAFNSTESIKTFKNVFLVESPISNGTTVDLSKEDYNRVILPYFCSKSSKNCQYRDGKIPEKCSMFFDQGEGGQICRAWDQESIVTQTWRTQTDEAKKAFCSSAEGHGLPECGCVNRNESELYTEIMKNGGSTIGLGNAGCWYIPCGDPNTYLVTSDISNDNCPDVVNCTQIIDIVGENVIIDDVEFNSTINCSSNEVKPDEPDEISKPPKTSWFWIFIAIMIFLFVVIIGVILWKFLSKGK